MKNAIIVQDMMDKKAITLSAETPVPFAIDTLLDNYLTAAPVVDRQGRLIGMFSAHDVMVELWCQDYLPNAEQKVVDLMTRDVIAINASDSLVDVAEFFCIDKEQLFPTTSMGIATRFNALSVEERAKSMKVSKPHVLPVLDKGQFVGVLNRNHVLAELRAIYGERVTAVKTEKELARA